MSQTIPSTPQTVKRVTLPPPFDCEALVYIDTVKVWIPRPRNLPPNKKPSILQQLWRANKSRLFSWPGGEDAHGQPHGWIVTLHQPTTEALQLLARRKRTLSNVEVAFDMPREIAQRAIPLLNQKWRGKRTMSTCGSTIYWGPRDAPRNIAYYEHKPSKVTGGPCGHLEFRFNGGEAVGRAGGKVGLQDPAKLLDGSVDFVGMLRHEVRLSAFGEKWQKEQMEKATALRNNKRRARKKPHERRERHAVFEKRFPCLKDMTPEEMVAHWDDVLRKVLQRVAQSEDDTPSYETIHDIPAQPYLDMLNGAARRARERYREKQPGKLKEIENTIRKRKDLIETL